MQARIDATARQTSSSRLGQVNVLQRKCACGKPLTDGKECADCARKRREAESGSIIQQKPANEASQRSTGESFGHEFARLSVMTSAQRQTQAKIDLSADPYEKEADQAAERVTAMLAAGPSKQLLPANIAFRAPLSIQREAADEDSPSSSGEAATTADQPSTSGPKGLLVEDSVEDLAPGQARKSTFLAEVRPAVEGAVAGSAGGASLLDTWTQSAENRAAPDLERDIQTNAPEAASATTAEDYIPIIAERARSAAGGASTSGNGDTGGTASTEGVSLKSRDGSAGATAANPAAIRSELGRGQPLEGGVRSRMESAFGMNFSDVRVHADSSAAQLSTRLNARAFAVGEHVAFGTGEYRPGTLVGDALLAHELAHVVQQGAGTPSASTDTGDTGRAYGDLERDADDSAANAVGSLWGAMMGGLKTIGKQAGPRLRSGLRLQRCPPGVISKVRYRKYGQTAFSEGACPAYCACVNDEFGNPVTGGDSRYVPRKGAGPCPPGLLLEWDGSTIKKETPLAKEPCGPGETRSGCD